MSLAEDKFSRRPTPQKGGRDSINASCCLSPAEECGHIRSGAFATGLLSHNVALCVVAADETDPAPSNDGHLIRPTGTLMHTPMALSVNLGSGRHLGQRIDPSTAHLIDLWIGIFDTDPGPALYFRSDGDLLIDHIHK
jgi:hypothetical protein